MSSLLCLGLGYCARFYVAAFGPRFAQITGTARTLAPARGVTMLAFDTTAGPPSTPVRIAVAGATHLLISATPGPSGDPIHAALAADILAAPRLAGIVYLSSLGVYGDHDGAWVDEDAATVPMHARGGARLAAEAQWQALGRRRGVAVAVLRLAGIYGPGRNIFTRLLAGRAHRVAKPGHVFNRVHVDDVAQAIDAAFARRFDGIVNVTDDAPAPYSEQVLLAAQLLGVPPPPELSIAQARALMSPMAFSFYAGCVRARNDRLKSGLGVTLRYPTYREGLHALFAQGYTARDPLQLAANAAS